MAAFYHDSSRSRLFDERINRSGLPCGPAACEIGLLEWFPGTIVFHTAINNTDMILDFTYPWLRRPFGETKDDRDQCPSPTLQTAASDTNCVTCPRPSLTLLMAFL